MSKRIIPIRLKPTKKRRLEQSNLQVVPKTEVSPDLKLVAPNYGTKVDLRVLKKAGPFILGSKIGHSPFVNCMIQVLARKENTKEFYQLKILILNHNPKDEEDEKLGKMLVHNEFSLLSLLQNEEGIIQHHGLFGDFAYEESTNENVKIYTGEVKKRLILVLDCVTAHDYNEKCAEFVNLQQYLKEGKIQESEAIQIFYEIVKIIERLHKKNIIHRDLKPVNIVFNRRTKKVTITNFSLGKELINENDLIHEKIGTPAYISPDVLCPQGYKGKPPDMWTLGVVLYTMLYEKFPFFDSNTHDLLKKIRVGDYVIPTDTKVSSDTQSLIKGILQLCPEDRLTASEVRDKLEVMITSRIGIRNELDQRVPNIVLTPKDEKREKYKHKFKDSPSLKPFECNRLSFSQLLELSASSKNTNFLNNNNSDYLIPGKSFDPRQLTQQDIRQLPQSILFLNNNERGSGGGGNGTRHAVSRNQWTNSNLNNSLAINQQMSNLTIRNQQELRRNLSWHDVRNYSTVSRNTGGDISTVRRFAACRLPPTVVVPFSTSSSSTSSRSSASSRSEPPTRHHLIQNLINTFNETFIQGRIPSINRNEIRDFDGVITQDLGQKITDWLRTEFMTNSIIRLIFGNGNDNEDEKVLELLRLLGVQMELSEGVTKIKREQSVDLLMIITYMLQAANYNNSYFIS